MSENEYPAMWVLSAVRRTNGTPPVVVAFADNMFTCKDEDQARSRLDMFLFLEHKGAAPYEYYLAPVAEVEAMVDATRERLSAEAGVPVVKPRPMTSTRFQIAGGVGCHRP